MAVNAARPAVSGRGGAFQAVLSRILQHSDVALAVGLMVILAMMVIPLPPAVLDVLISLNIAMAVTILLMSMYAKEPLEFSVFPSLLLVVTLFRLALNVSSTRLILLHADAGEVIRAFGQFVVGGNYVIGVVVFLILTVIQFVVITNGAGRVAEVAARFTLDAMPGKQMSIDADLNAGLITEDEARRRRRAIEEEADFYGAMDGASKFVKGDAIAGIVIVLVNIFGGFAVGMLQQGLTLQESLRTFTLLTVGDGLVSQIPALLISTATGIIITRTASEQTLGHDMFRQLVSNPKALFVVSGMVAALGVVPGLPHVPFFIIAAGTAGVAFFLRQSLKEQAALAVVEASERAKEEASSVDSVVQLLPLDPMEIEIGYGLIPLVDEDQPGNLLNRITMIRRQVALELGIVVPTIRIRDNLQLSPNTYVVKLRGIEIGRGELLANHWLAMNAGLAEGELDGIPTTEPAFGLPATWITAAQKERAEMQGYTVVDPPSVVATHLSELIKRHAPNILSRQDVQSLLNTLKADYPAVVEELVPNLLTLGDVQKVLQNLLAERISVRDLVTICETLASYARYTKDPEMLTEYVRQALSRSISAQHKDAQNVIRVMTLNPALEQLLANALQQSEQGMNIVLEPGLSQRILQATARQMEAMAAAGHMPVLLCSARIRRAFKKLVERALPNLTVLSFSEISQDVEVQSVAVVDIDEG
ncbi:MAG TPA: flagellar biosynthesis protein FlhA [Dehalococcoidia bacterium]